MVPVGSRGPFSKWICNLVRISMGSLRLNAYFIITEDCHRLQIGRCLLPVHRLRPVEQICSDMRNYVQHVVTFIIVFR